ncbi:MAG: hypothetical protein V3U24_05725 [Candidatus Neomarinimicrobiota bacterium]
MIDSPGLVLAIVTAVKPELHAVDIEFRDDVEIMPSVGVLERVNWNLKVGSQNTASIDSDVQ